MSIFAPCPLLKEVGLPNDEQYEAGDDNAGVYVEKLVAVVVRRHVVEVRGIDDEKVDRERGTPGERECSER